MEQKQELNLDELKDVSGGSSMTEMSTRTVTCIYCGQEISLTGTKSSKGKKTGVGYTCACGAQYNPSLGNPWIAPPNSGTVARGSTAGPFGDPFKTAKC